MKKILRKTFMLFAILVLLSGCKKIKKAGNYEAFGMGRKGHIKVSVTIDSGGEISDVELLEYEDNKEFVERAFKELRTRIIEENSTDVDVVSGATESSKGILNAVENAVEQADKN